MRKYAKIINDETKLCEVGIGKNSKFYQSIGMTLQDVEQGYDGSWYLQGYAPQKSNEEKAEEKRQERNAMLVQEVDPLQLVLRWENLSDEEKKQVREYRQYLLTIPEQETFPQIEIMTFEEWKEYIVKVEEVADEC